VKRILKNKYTVSLVKSETFTQAAKYFIVGGSCTVFDFSMLFIFTHFLKINYLPSSILAFTISAIVNYYLCVSWVFSIRVVEKRHREFIYYLLLSVMGLGISTLLIWTLTEFLGLYFMLSKLIATFVTYWCNFGARKYFLHT
jgi:putative flippase GtrA